MNKYLRLSFVLLLSAFPLLVASSTMAQEGPPALSLRVDVDLTELHVTVVDNKDRPVGGLLQEHFKIFENRVEQSISLFKQEDIPVSLGLIIDNSRSIEPRKQRLDAAAISFVRQSNPDDETFIVHFDSEARLSRQFTSDEKLLEQTLDSTKPYGETAIFDAVMVALDNMEKAQYSKKALLLVTDGIDNMSRASLEDVVERLKHESVAVYAVGLLSQSGGLKAEDSLIKMAETSGGRAYFPETVDEARTMMGKIARDLREQYTLGYFPTNRARDGAWRSVRIELTPPKGFPPDLGVKYRYGYYGPSAEPR